MKMKEACIPHAVQLVNDGAYQARMTRYQHRGGTMDTTAVFQKIVKAYNEKGELVEKVLNCVVGEEALNFVLPRKGADKYVSQYLDVYAVAILTKLYPDGHDNIILGFAHPSDAIPHLNTVGQILLGKHVIIRPDGKKITYTIRAIISVDEPTGGIVRAMTNDYRSEDFIVPGDEIVIADIGGKISSLVLCQYMPDKSIKVFFTNDSAFEYGIQDLQSALNEILRSQHPHLFTRKVDPKVINQIILNRGKAALAGTAHDFTAEFTEASQVILTAIENVYDSGLNRAYTAKAVYVSGGGGGLLFDSLCTIFKQPAFLADTAPSIHMANARGAHYAVLQTILNQRNEPQYTKILSRDSVAIAIIDGGNTNGKGVASDIINK